MQTAKVMVTYDPVSGQFFAENPVKVYPGVTQIEWSISLNIPTSGDIVFGTQEHFPGIKFDKEWPGTPPRGDERRWQADVKDTLKPGDEPVSYHYTINCWYRTGDKATPPIRMSWDPDVEEGGGEPPPLNHA